MNIDKLNCFNNECFIYFAVTCSSALPLDLRTSPVIRRTLSDSSFGSQFKKPPYEAINLTKKSQSDSRSPEAPVPEEISENRTATSCYLSCQSLAPTNSENLIEETPKINSNEKVLKKTISFEITPIEEMTNMTMFNTACGGEDNDDVFLTPCATPVRSYSFPSADLKPRKPFQSQVQCVSTSTSTENEKSGKGSDIWSIVTSVIRVASRKSDKSHKEKDESDEKLGENRHKSFPFSKGIIQKAASFAGFFKSTKYEETTSSDAPAPKRRRLVANEANNLTSPLKKKQKIIGRKPIDRMRIPS